MSEGFGEDSGRVFAGLAVGSLVAGYRLEARIGAGGMAVVFRARDERLGRVVALKVLSPALEADEAFRRRFVRECRAAAAVDDPHIIPVHDAGEAAGVLFIAMRYVPGGDARALLARQGPLTAGRVAAIISPVASALDAAHAAGLVHRDVKPANMLVDSRPGRPDHVYLSDFGLSKGALSSAGLTGSGLFLGTPNYTSPEQIQGGPVDGRADQYALACSAFELLAGEAPFQRDDAMAVVWAQVSQSPPLLTSRRSDLPAAADGVLARALAKSPQDRYNSCREFADALRQALDVLPYDSDPAIAQLSHPPTVVASAPRAAAGQSDDSTIGQRPARLGIAAGLSSPRAFPPDGLSVESTLGAGSPAQRPGGFRLRITASATFTLTLLCIGLFLLPAATRYNVEIAFLAARASAFLGAIAILIGAFVSFFEWRYSRLDGFAHGWNSSGIVLAALAAVAIHLAVGDAANTWLGFAIFMPLALGNIACSAFALVQGRKADIAQGLILATATGCIAVGQVLLALSTAQKDTLWPFAEPVLGAASVLFLAAFLISCLAVRLVIVQRTRLGSQASR